MAANRAVDEYAIKSCGIPGHELMQHAGDALVEQMSKHGYLKHSPQVVVLAGHGNNGGDGFVIAAGLYRKGISVSLITIFDEKHLSGDALLYFNKLKDLDLRIETWKHSEDQIGQILEADVIVDALLGTGISGQIRPPFDALITLTNQSTARCVAVDVPSGVTGDKGEVLEACIQADLTVSMGFGKQGCLFEPARSYSGTIVPVEIGFPEDSLEHVQGEILWQNSDQDFPPAKFNRPGNTHKYSAGKVFIIAGSQGFTGAALLASRAALRSGAGLVRLAIPNSLGPIAECLSLETVVDYLPEGETRGIALAALPDLLKGCEWADTVVIGPGLGRHPETIEIVKRIVKESACQRLVIDADALFALSDDPSILLERSAATILTPHAGEFKRLINAEGRENLTWEDAQNFAKKYTVSLLLKGAPSILALPSGDVIVNSTGYAGMATAGSGDVLSGVIASLWSQWMDAEDVLSFAMYIHGKAADRLRPDKGVLGLIASDIIEGLPNALKEYGGLSI